MIIVFKESNRSLSFFIFVHHSRTELLLKLYMWDGKCHLFSVSCSSASIVILCFLLCDCWPQSMHGWFVCSWLGCLALDDDSAMTHPFYIRIFGLALKFLNFSDLIYIAMVDLECLLFFCVTKKRSFWVIF